MLLRRYDPPNPLWGAVRDEGPGWRYIDVICSLLAYNYHQCLRSVVLYLLIKPETQAALENVTQASPAIRLLKRFIEEDELRVRFKVSCFKSSRQA